MSQTSIAISDSHELFREGLEHLLLQSSFSVIASAGTLVEAMMEPAGSPTLELVVCGIAPGCDQGTQLEALERCCSLAPGIRFVVLAQAPDQNLVHRAVSAGVDAVLSKNISGEVLQRSLELVMLGQQLFPASIPEVANNSAPGPIPFPRPFIVPPASLQDNRQDQPPTRLVLASGDHDRDVLLSEREAEILQCLVRGSSNKAIARDLHIAEATVKVHIKGLLRKLRVHNRTQAAIWGIGNGYGLAKQA